MDEIPTTPVRTAGNVVRESEVAPSGSARNYADCYGAENNTASSPNRISTSEQSHDALVASLQSHDASEQSYDISVLSHEDLEQSHDTSVQSHDALVQSHDATVPSQYATLQYHDATVQSHDASVQSHDALVASVQSHDPLEQYHDSSEQSHDATVQSHDALQGSQERYQLGGLGFRYNATLKIKNSSGLVFHGNMQSTSSLWQPSQQGLPQASNAEKETSLEQPLLDDSTRTESVMFDCGTNPSLRVSMIKDESNMPGASVAPPAGETHELWHLTVSSGYASSVPSFTQTIVTSGGDVSNYNREPPSGGAGNLSISSGQISESNSVENVNLIHGNNEVRIVPTPPGGDEENYSTLFPSDGEELLDEYGEDAETFGRENDPVVERFIENSAVMTSTENRAGFLHDIAFLNSNGRGEQEEEEDESFTPPPVRSRRAKRRKKQLKTLKQQYQRFKTLPPAEDDLSINVCIIQYLSI